MWRMWCVKRGWHGDAERILLVFIIHWFTASGSSCFCFLMPVPWLYDCKAKWGTDPRAKQEHAIPGCSRPRLRTYWWRVYDSFASFTLSSFLPVCCSPHTPRKQTCHCQWVWSEERRRPDKNRNEQKAEGKEKKRRKNCVHGCGGTSGASFV